AAEAAARERLDQSRNDHPRLAIEGRRKLAQAGVAGRSVEPGQRGRAVPRGKPYVQAIDVQGAPPRAATVSKLTGSARILDRAPPRCQSRRAAQSVPANRTRQGAKKGAGMD